MKQMTNKNNGSIWHLLIAASDFIVYGGIAIIVLILLWFLS
jgi:hypothetical protein